MCREMSQYIPSSAVKRAPVATPAGSAAHAGRPDTRSAKAPARARTRFSPERWVFMSHSSPTGARVAKPVAITTCPMAAPPAGFAATMAAAVSSPLVIIQCYTDPCRMKPRWPPRVTDVPQADLTIAELARRTGMTVRNVRAHQSRGLLPAPEVRGRTGYYGPEHIARIELIRELQSEGFNLEAIRRLLAGSAGSSTDVLRFTRALREPFEDEEPVIVDALELTDRFRSADPRLLAKAERLGVLRPVGDGRYEEMSPRLARAGEELAALGVPAEVAIEVVARLRRHADGVARTFVRLFLEQVWKPFDETGRPEESWPEVHGALERLRPLASEALVGVFQLAMNDAVDHAFGEVLERDAGKRRR